MYEPTVPVPPISVEPRYFEAVIVCVNYSDFLAYTLPTNQYLFDKIVVVTTTTDKLTKNLCDYYNIECVQTDVFYEDGDVFNKGKGINEGLKRLSKRDWVIHLDADVYLPPLSRLILNNRHLDKESVYGLDRLMCHSIIEWNNFLQNPRQMHELYYLVQPNAFPLGTRVAHYNQPDGWFPIGFFQLWNPKGSKIFSYPIDSSGADHTDVVFAKRFPRGKRVFIPEFFTIHLDSGRAEMGANWNGRTTNKFSLSKVD